MHAAVFFLACLPLALQALTFVGPPGSRSSRDILSNSREAREAARLATGYQNYLTGSVHQLLEFGEVKKATVKFVPEIGHKYYVEFTVRFYNTMTNIGLCKATVFFQENKPRPAINVNCSSTSNQKQASDNDYNFYELVKSQTVLITGENIPDNPEDIATQLDTVWRLTFMGSGYVIWDKTTEGHEYYIVYIDSVKQVLRKDNLIAFDYVLMLLERPSEDRISCSVHLAWIPGKPPKVDYTCTENSENGSGIKSEDGSAFQGNFK